MLNLNPNNMFIPKNIYFVLGKTKNNSGEANIKQRGPGLWVRGPWATVQALTQALSVILSKSRSPPTGLSYLLGKIGCFRVIISKTPAGSKSLVTARSFLGEGFGKAGC